MSRMDRPRQAQPESQPGTSPGPGPAGPSYDRVRAQSGEGGVVDLRLMRVCSQMAALDNTALKLASKCSCTHLYTALFQPISPCLVFVRLSVNRLLAYAAGVFLFNTSVIKGRMACCRLGKSRGLLSSSLLSRLLTRARWVGALKQAGQESATTGKAALLAKAAVWASRT